MVTKAWIFYIDGTLANIDHRQHYVMNKPKNFKKFNEMMIHDQPNHDIIDILKTFYLMGRACLVSSGREDKFRQVTNDWFMIHGVPYTKLYMRISGDNRPDDVVKQEILQQMRMDGYDPVMAFDDRNKVVAMWR